MDLYARVWKIPRLVDSRVLANRSLDPNKRHMDCIAFQFLIFIPTPIYATLRLLLLSLGGPLGCLVLSSLFELVSLLLGLVNGRLCMLGGSVNGEQAQRGWASVDDWFVSYRLEANTKVNLQLCLVP